ncbi:MAG: helix-turn-helix domain-containing protein [Opitutales bacterium]
MDACPLVTSWFYPVPVGQSPWHSHTWTEVVFHRQGHGEILTRDHGSWPFTAGSIDLMPAYLRHRQVNAGTGRDFCLIIRTPAIDRPHHLRPPLPSDLPPLLEHLAYTHEKASHNLEPGARRIRDLRTTLLIERLLERARGPKRQPAEPAAEALARAIDRILEADIGAIRSIGDLAGRLDRHPDYLRNAYRQRRGQSLNRAVIGARIRKARVLLQEGGPSLKAIAASCGYRNVQYFTTQFRKATGVTPGRWQP